MKTNHVPKWAIVSLSVVGVIVIVLCLTLAFGGNKSQKSNYHADAVNDSNSSSSSDNKNSDSTGNKDTSKSSSSKTSEATATNDKPEIASDAKISEIEGFSEKEVKSALSFAVDYANTTRYNTYYAGGSFSIMNKNDLNIAKSTLSPYFSKELLNEEIGKMKNLKGDALAKKLSLNIFYFGDNGMVKPDPGYCKLQDDTKQPETLKKGDTVKVGPECISYYEVGTMNYNSVKNKDNNNYTLDVNFPTTTVIPIVSDDDGTKGYLIAQYTNNLKLEPYIADSGETAWQIVSYDNSINIVTNTGSAPSTKEEVEKALK